jgi:hypothetical protein
VNTSSDQIGRYLEGRAQANGENGIVFYGDLAAHFGLPEIDDRWHQHPLCKIFDTLDQEDSDKHRPFRTALVVSKEKNIPGQGFFNTVILLRKPTPHLRTEIERMKFFIDELGSPASYYSKKEK